MSTITKEVIGKFIDASVSDHTEAKQLLIAYPGIRFANWLGDQSILSFLVVENFLVGIRFCLDNGFDPNPPVGEYEEPPLIYACKLGRTAAALELLKKGANPNTPSLVEDNPLHCCIRNGDAKILDMLITHGADPNYSTELGENILHNWPNDAEKQSAISNVLLKHGIKHSV